MRDEPKHEKLEETNQQLHDSLKACRELVAEYRAKLAANGNEPLLLNQGDLDIGTARS